MDPSFQIRRALDSYRVRSWAKGPRCPCGCKVRIPWSILRSIGVSSMEKRYCLCGSLPRMQRLFQPTLEEFRSFLFNHRYRIVKQIPPMEKRFESWGDEYLAAFLQNSWIAREYTHPTGSVRGSTWNFYISHLLYGQYPMSVKVMQNWFLLQTPIPTSTLIGLLRKYKGLSNPRFRNLLRDGRNKSVIAVAASLLQVKGYQNPLFPLCKSHAISKKICGMQWTMTLFWIVHVRAKVRAWKTSHSLRTRVPYTEKESITQLLLRNPARIPKAAYVFSCAIHRDPEAFLGTTFYMKQSQDLHRWTEWVANDPSPIAYRCLRKIWKTCSRTNMVWYFLFARILLEAKVSHNRLLCSVLHQALSRPAQFSSEMSQLFHTCMQSSRARPQVVAKFLYISQLRNISMDLYQIQDLLATPAISANLHECVFKQLSHGMSNRMILHLAYKERTEREQTLWESKVIQSWFHHLQDTYGPVLQRFYSKVPSLWRAKQEKRRILLARAPHLFRILVVHAEYKWRILQSTECPICMESKVGQMIPLHMDMRHGICKDCRDTIQNTTNCCPICRTSLAIQSDTNDERDEHEENPYGYEDESYDDDQWYHYY